MQQMLFVNKLSYCLTTTMPSLRC